MNTIGFPYKQFKGTAAWRELDRALGGLVQNKDLIEQTPREYIVGYILKELNMKGLLTNEALTIQSGRRSRPSPRSTRVRTKKRPT